MKLEFFCPQKAYNICPSAPLFDPIQKWHFFNCTLKTSYNRDYKSGLRMSIESLEVEIRQFSFLGRLHLHQWMLLEDYQSHGKCTERCHNWANWCCWGWMKFKVFWMFSQLADQWCSGLLLPDSSLSLAEPSSALISLLTRSLSAKSILGEHGAWKAAGCNKGWWTKSVQDAKCLSRWCQLQVKITPVPVALETFRDKFWNAQNV
jgi:hypothetical protein